MFDRWLARLKDTRGKALIITRIRAAKRGIFGDCGSIGGGVSEMPLHYGPGYRVYFYRKDEVVYILLCGGTNRGQRRDIARAQALVRNLKDK